ncbi:sigma-54-dependent transcriptional regulator [Aestuariispira ectoiniformans]|uniref:sigma-54-dependent transcriptional regulator n=1 Tax=Aestuariispira ectoiniformans TaxID=2775080 RepID=UPI00223A9DC7|nr:sigma-54 dependent transcriptional regulator [Aestuariispira ectoiniformans]
MTKPAVILIDDEEHIRQSCLQALELEGIPARAFAEAETALHAITPDFDGVVVSDIRMPGLDGLTVLSRIVEQFPNLPVILITGHGDIAMAVEAMRKGAYDFIEKPFQVDRLIDVIRRGLEKHRLVQENNRLRSLLDKQTSDAEIAGRLIGRAPAMVELQQQVAAIAGTNADVLILGETGSGKEMVARCLHEFSNRRDGHFVAINCGALPANIIESELFGHEVGAFTGADKQRIGKFEYASGGTLFLDEVESMPMDLQIRLLRVLQERQVERLGSNEAIPIDVRIIAATKTDLLDASHKGEFREDLYYRLNVVTLTIPPLRQRREDIPLLFTQFSAQAALRLGQQEHTLEDSILQGLMGYEWPGNVRELRNAAERHAMGLSPLPQDRSKSSDGKNSPSLQQQMDAFERSLLINTLERTKGQVQETCERLHLPRKTFYDKLKKHGLTRADFEG